MLPKGRDLGHCLGRVLHDGARCQNLNFRAIYAHPEIAMLWVADQIIHVGEATKGDACALKLRNRRLAGERREGCCNTRIDGVALCNALSVAAPPRLLRHICII